ncbi:hypothetical protein CYMTET_26079, partial [Cymbomonas tetramitiformis]
MDAWSALTKVIKSSIVAAGVKGGAAHVKSERCTGRWIVIACEFGVNFVVGPGVIAGGLQKTVTISEDFLPLFDDFSTGLATLCRSLTEFLRWKDQVLQLLPSGSVTPLAVISSEVLRSKAYLTSSNCTLWKFLLGDGEEDEFGSHE